MNSSGIKRGLAVTAISALACVGLPMTATAQTVAQGEPALDLYSQYSGGASTRNDGTNTTVTLFAGVPTQIAATTVNGIQFQYSTDAGATWTNIGGQVVPIDGVATTQWTPPSQPPAITTVRAVALDNANNPLATDAHAVTVSNSAPAVKLDGALRSEVGQWGGEIVVSGKTSAATGAPNVVVNSLGPVGAPVAGSTPTLGDPDTNNNRTFKAHVDVSAQLTADARDEVVIGAQSSDLLGTSDDVTAYRVYDQVVTGVTAPLAANSNANVPAGSGADTKWVITAVDQNGAPIQGLDIYEADASGAAANGAATPDGTSETNDNGKLTVTLNEGTIAGNASSQSGRYVVDVNENGTYEPGTDSLLTFTQSRYTVTPTTVTTTSNLGTSVDDDEVATLTFTVKDQNGNPVQGATVLWSDKRTNMGLPSSDANYVTYPTDDPNVTGLQYANAGTTNANGVVTVTLPNRNNINETHEIDAYVNLNGTPAPDQGDAIAAQVDINSGLSKIEWDNGATAQAKNGTTTTQSGTLSLSFFGDKLGNRPVKIDLTDKGDVPTVGNDAGNAVLAPQTDQPEGTVRGSDTTANATTAADGSFSVAVQDPATPNGEELDVEITAQAPTLESANDQTDKVLSIDFLRTLVPTRIVIENGAGTDDATDAPFGDLEPGKYGVGYVAAFNADGRALTDISVPVTIAEGTFIDPENPFDPAPAVGAEAGEWSSLGKSINVTLDDNGRGLFLFNIERNAGFDDDGLVSDKINAGTGSASFEYDFTWDTIGTPLNPGDTPLVVELSDSQESTILPQARVGQQVNWDVETYDQFGNRTQQGLTVRDNTPLATTFGNNSAFDLAQPAIVAEANRATSQALEVELNGATKFTYVDDPANSTFDPVNPLANTVSLTSADVQVDTDAIEWYDVDAAASIFTLEPQGDDTVPVGTTVTMVVNALDQNGQPLYGPNVTVSWVRSGPGDNDSDGNFGDVTTDMNGNAYYDFAGTSAGDAEVTAIVSVNGTRVARLVDTVTFGGQGSEDKIAIEVTAQADDNGGKRDVLRVQTDPAAAGAEIEVYRVRGTIKAGNRRLILQRTDLVAEDGVNQFSFADRNGNKKARFVVVIKETDTTLEGRSNFVKVR